MKTRIIHTKVWEDEWFVGLPRTSKLLFIFILTCHQNNITSIFELPDRVITFNTGLTAGEIEQSKVDLSQRVVFYKGWVKIIHADKYNNYVSNSKMETAKSREISLIPEEIYTHLNEYDTSIDTSIHTSIYTPNNHKSEIINNKSVIERGVGRDEIGDEVLQEMADKYQVSLAFVKSKYEDMINWSKSTGKTRKDWVATLRNFVKGDAIKIKQGGSNVRQSIDARDIK